MQVSGLDTPSRKGRDFGKGYSPCVGKTTDVHNDSLIRKLFIYRNFQAKNLVELCKRFLKEVTSIISIFIYKMDLVIIKSVRLM